MESMGVATGCGCKEVYRFPHTTYPYSCICSFLQQHPYFFTIIKYVIIKYVIIKYVIIKYVIIKYVIINLRV